MIAPVNIDELWADMPTETLFALLGAGRLRAAVEILELSAHKVEFRHVVDVDTRPTGVMRPTLAELLTTRA